MLLKSACGGRYSHPSECLRFPVTGGRRQGRRSKAQQGDLQAVTHTAALHRGTHLTAQVTHLQRTIHDATSLRMHAIYLGGVEGIALSMLVISIRQAGKASLGSGVSLHLRNRIIWGSCKHPAPLLGFPCTSRPFSKELCGKDPGISEVLTDLGPLRGNPGHGWGALGQLGDGPLGDTQGAAVGSIAEDGQADLLLGDGGLWGLAFSWGGLLVPGCLFVQQVADLHDVPDDLHRACQILLPCWQVILGFLQVGCWCPALFAQVSAGRSGTWHHESTLSRPQSPSGLAQLSFLCCAL